MKKILNKIDKHNISFLILFIVALSTFKTTCENDLFFDLKTGESIIKYGLDFKDHFSWIPNLQYIYLHWLYDIIIYFIYQKSSFDGLFIFYFIIFYIFSIVFYLELYKCKKNKISAVLVSVIMIYFCNIYFVSRVQSIIYLLLFFEVIFLERLYVEGNKKNVVYLSILSILIVNLQMPIWIFSIILYLPFLCESLIYKVIKKFNILNDINVKKSYNNKLLFASFIIALLGGLISPYKFKPLTFFIDSLGNSIYLQTGIGEMQITDLINKKIILIIHLLFISFTYFKRMKISIRDFFLINGLFIFSLIVKKNIIFYIYFGLFLLYKCINADMNFLFYNFKKKYKINHKVIKIFLTIILIPYSIICIYYKKDTFNNFGLEYYQVQIADYILKNINYKESKIFTDYGSGSYYEFKDIPVFVDSRAEVYIKEFNGGYDILGDYNKLLKVQHYKEVLEKYDFDYLAVYNMSNLYSFLDKETDYCVIYTFNDYSLFEHIRFEKYFNVKK